MLCDGCLSRYVPSQVAAVASVPAWVPRRVANEDGGAAETYRGILTVAGVRYSFEVLLLADVDGAYSVANVSRFTPWNGRRDAGCVTPVDAEHERRWNAELGRPGIASVAPALASDGIGRGAEFRSP